MKPGKRLTTTADTIEELYHYSAKNMMRMWSLYKRLIYCAPPLCEEGMEQCVHKVSSTIQNVHNLKLRIVCLWNFPCSISECG